ncbi:universal stress protein [Streptomyces smyrnaeus]|uniref:universal stress protein n=1 Tax=Streptomyces TaxID=1883 RepID=UPI000C198AE7|nr:MULTISPECIES: universal stress protein [unclassified Streptomyces]MBQ0865123.1 universal stress protein [Streptomyces sp. RK75]MBQ1119650.1 universal stress protein [Streptomyces sp. B15]MBQ1158696.1 universal stress protein [Streptomyces sp. A73]
MSGTVVVGVDGSPSSLAAVDIAAQEAKLRGGSLRVVHAFVWPMMKVPLGPSAVGPPEGGLRSVAHRTAEEAAARAKSSQPTVEVTHAVIVGEPLSVLTTESRDAELVVVGTRGLGGFTGLLVGSVAVYLTAHAECPVLVTRGRKHPTGPVLLGVDGSEVGDAAVGWAFEEASLRGAELVALHNWNAWTGPVAAGPSVQVPTYYDVDLYRAEEESVLATAIAGWRERYPDVEVTPRLVQEYTRQALIAASEESQLLVVGARGRGGFTGLLLGSVSQAVLHHADCPVAIVRADRERRHAPSSHRGRLTDG